jgi:hypothetical protein
MMRLHSKILTRCLAVLFTLLPWVSALAQPRPIKSETSLSSPHQPAPNLAQMPAQPSTPPSFDWGPAWMPVLRLGAHLEFCLPGSPSFQPRAWKRFILLSGLKTDGG